MAKKRVQGDLPEEDGTSADLPVGYENVEPEAVEDELTLDEFVSMPLDEVANKYIKPGGPAVSLDTDERTYRVSFALPYGVLVALLDAEHVDADIQGARAFGLLSDKPYSVEQSPNKTVYKYSLTELSQKVLDGIDQTAIRHKMLAAWREQHNRGVDSDKTGFKKAE